MPSKTLDKYTGPSSTQPSAKAKSNLKGKDPYCDSSLSFSAGNISEAKTWSKIEISDRKKQNVNTKLLSVFVFWWLDRDIYMLRCLFKVSAHFLLDFKGDEYLILVYMTESHLFPHIAHQRHQVHALEPRYNSILFFPRRGLCDDM